MFEEVLGGYHCARLANRVRAFVRLSASLRPSSSAFKRLSPISPDRIARYWSVTSLLVVFVATTDR